MVIYADDNKVTAGDAGTWVDGARGRHMSSAILDAAEAYGYPISKNLVDAMKEEEESVGEDDFDRDEFVDRYEWINEEIDRAEQWMNERVAPIGYMFGYHPSWGDWGLYSPLAWTESVMDLQGLTVAFSDLEEWLQEEMKDSKAENPVVFVYHGRNYYLLTTDAVNNIPEIIDIGEVDWTGDDYRTETVTIEINVWKPNAEKVGRKANYQFPKQAMSGTSPVTIVVATKWSRGGNGEYPVRFVVVEWPPVRGQMNGSVGICRLTMGLMTATSYTVTISPGLKMQ